MSEEIKEIWVDIKGYENKYQISNHGRVKSLYFINGRTKKFREKILSYGYNLQGYRFVRLSKNGKSSKNLYIHKLVAKHFLPNPNNYIIVNHINGIKIDNRVENLEWCTYSHNTKESYRLRLQKPTWKGKTGIENPNSKKVRQYDLEDNFIKQWDCLRDVQRELKIFAISISRCCKGNQETAGGYKWRYAND